MDVLSAAYTTKIREQKWEGRISLEASTPTQHFRAMYV